ncbi:long-chain fatty acid--CoA ligase [bacterium]|nr:long-chain fatty acid--CoA ligase [bacterium]
MTLTEMLERSVKRYGRRYAILFKGEKITYNELGDRVVRLASGLMEKGAKKGNRIGILLGNCPEFIISYFAILKMGGIVVPLNNFLKGEELRYILNNAGVSTLIISEEYMKTVGPLRPRLEELERIVISNKSSISGTLSPKRGVAPSGLYALEELMTPEVSVTFPEVAETETAVIIYTSGTTGHPKGACLSHNNLISNITASAQAARLRPRDNFLLVLPMFHSFTTTVCILIPLYLGAKITIVESLRVFGEVIKEIIRKRPTIFVAIPAIYNILTQVSLPRILTFRPLRFLNPIRLAVSGAAALPVEVLKKFEKKFGIPLIEGYGLSEASPVVSLNPVKGVRKPGSVGLALPGVDVDIVDNNGHSLKKGEVGELIVRGPNVMRGYYNLPRETEETLKRGWLYTGDLAKMDEESYVYIVDRKKDMINVRGLNVYPREVEEVLYSHPAIAEAAVIGVKDKVKGEVPEAFLALKEGRKLSKKEIIKYCQERLASYKVPHKIEFRKELPKTSTGKILKRALKEASEKSSEPSDDSD